MTDVTGPRVPTPWSLPGWQARVMRWVKAKLKETPYWPIESIEEVRAWDISCVYQIKTGGGNVYFKAVPSFFASEARLTALLAHLFPKNVPQPLAIDARRNWMLLNDLGKSDLQKAEPEEWYSAANLLATMQTECVGRVNELFSAGAADRRLRHMPDELDNLLADERFMSLMSEESRPKLREAAPKLKELCARLGEYGIPETLAHGDFHGGNIAKVDRRHIVFDWTDTSITHPFLDIICLLNWYVPPEKPAEQAKLIDTYLQSWKPWGKVEDLREAVRISVPVGNLYQIITYRHIINALGGEVEEIIKNGLQMWVDRVIASV